MQSAIQAEPASKKQLWTGRTLSILAVLFMLFDAAGHIVKPAPVMQAFVQLGFPLRLSVTLGIIQLLCVLIYVIPRTAVLGAVLLTGYLRRCGRHPHARRQPALRMHLFPILIGILFWAGLLLRDRRLRHFFPVSN